MDAPHPLKRKLMDELMPYLGIAIAVTIFINVRNKNKTQPIPEHIPSTDKNWDDFVQQHWEELKP
jgi:hypothetical protein